MLFAEKGKTTLLQIRMKEEEKEFLREISKKNNMTISDFVKKACNEYIKVLEQKEK